MNNTILPQTLTNLIKSSALLSTYLLSTPPVHSAEYEYGDWLFTANGTLGAAVQWRTESRDETLIEDINADDGNNNFDPGLTSAKANVLLELGGEYRNLSFFLRADALYDHAYEGRDTDLTEEGYLSYNGAIPNGGDVKLGDFPQETLDEHGSRTRLLDAFLTYNFDLDDQSGAFRLGRQVIAWGEATFYQGVNSRQNPNDGGVASAPGVEAKEIFLPTSAALITWSFNDNLSTEAYYKLDWEETTLSGVGSFLSTTDVAGPGEQRLLFPQGGSIPITQSEKAEDSGEYGLVMRYLTDSGTNFDLSYTRSHNYNPVVETKVDVGTIENSFSRRVYVEDVDFWQLSFSTNLGEAQVYGDLSYSDNATFLDKTQGFVDGFYQVAGFERGHYWQGVVGMTDMYTAFPWLADQIMVLAEAHVQGNNLGKNDLEDTPYLVTDNALGYQFRIQLNYFSVINGLDLEVPIFFRHDAKGYGNGVVMSNALYEHDKQASIGVDAFYLNNWQLGFKYAWYFGSENKLGDRDNVSLVMKYTF